MVTIKVGFAPEDHHAEAFRQRFISDGEADDLATP
jgi:hypothetical protein